MKSQMQHTAPTTEKEPTTAEKRAPGTTAAYVTRDIWIRHQNGLAHTPYSRGQVVPAGSEADELFRLSPHVVPLGEESTFRVCPAIDCGAHVPVEAIRAGKVRVLNAHRAIAPVQRMLGERWVDIPTGDILELLWAPEAAGTIFGQAADRFELSGLTVYRARCPACGAPADYVLAPDERAKKISAGGE